MKKEWWLQRCQSTEGWMAGRSWKAEKAWLEKVSNRKKIGLNGKMGQTNLELRWQQGKNNCAEKRNDTPKHWKTRRPSITSRSCSVPAAVLCFPLQLTASRASTLCVLGFTQPWGTRAKAATCIPQDVKEIWGGESLDCKRFDRVVMEENRMQFFSILYIFWLDCFWNVTERNTKLNSQFWMTAMPKIPSANYDTETEENCPYPGKFVLLVLTWAGAVTLILFFFFFALFKDLRI